VNPNRGAFFGKACGFMNKQLLSSVSGTYEGSEKDSSIFSYHERKKKGGFCLFFFFLILVFFYCFLNSSK
jgi:hypothetical protein